MIRYLKQEEYVRCLPLWREAFPEDSGEFLDYYFNKKLKKGKVLVKEDEHGCILTMAHLNPYKVNVRGRIYRLSYIGGVATAASGRRRGHMREVLLKMLQDMHRDEVPFCYLMPADPAIYRPFGFAAVFDQPSWRLGDAGLKAKRVRLCLKPFGAAPSHGEIPQAREDGVPDWEELARWMNCWLNARFQVYAIRDEEYLDMLQAELDSEDGQVWGLFDEEGKLGGLQAFWGITRREQRFLYCAREEWMLPETLKQSGHPGIMVRITNVQAMMETVTVNEECPCSNMEVLIRIHDELEEGNDGLWRWKLRACGSKLVREPAGGFGAEVQPEAAMDDTLYSTEVLDLTISALASWLFGYADREEKQEEEGERPFWIRYVRTLEGVFLDEII